MSAQNFSCTRLTTNPLADATNSFAEYVAIAKEPLIVCICVVGILLNPIYIFVLTKPTMRTTVNSLLIAIAAMDLLTMISSLIFTVGAQMLACNFDLEYGYQWQAFLIVHADLSVLCHSVSLWLAVCISILRFVILRRRTVISTDTVDFIAVSVVVVSTIIFSGLFCILNFLRNNVIDMPEKTYYRDDCGNSTVTASKDGPKRYLFGSPPWWTDELDKTNFWIMGVVFKVAPCFLLFIFMTLLVNLLLDARRMRMRLLTASERKNSVADRTTVLLLVIVFIVWITELPHGILFVGSAFNCSLFALYKNLGDVFDLVTLCSGSINFLLYCAMSENFRRQIYDVIFARVRPTPKRRFSPQQRPSEIRMEPLLSDDDAHLPVSYSNNF